MIKILLLIATVALTTLLGVFLSAYQSALRSVFKKICTNIAGATFNIVRDTHIKRSYAFNGVHFSHFSNIFPCDSDTYSVPDCNKTVFHLLGAIPSAIRAMKPDVILTDELYGEDDIKAVKYAADCGICVIASSHAVV